MRYRLLISMVLAAVGFAAAPAMALEEKAPTVGDVAATDTPPTGFTVGATGLSPYYSASGITFDQLMQDDADGLADTNRSLTYFTPRFGGLQLGVRYHPDDADGASPSSSPADGAVDVGMSYNNEVGTLGLTVFAGSSGGTSVKDLDTDPTQDRQWGVGGQLQLGAFSVGAEVSRDGMALDQPAGERTDWTVGLAYRTALWGVSLGYARKTGGVDADLSGDPQNQVELSAVYDLGPGAVLSGGARWLRQDATDAETGDVDDALALIFGTKLSF
jgi:predicted porin